MLEHLNFSGAFHVGDIGMGYIAARCRRLRTLRLRGSDAVPTVASVL
jgi:hypothetical protein